MTTDKTNHAEEEAKAQYESVREMIAALNCDYDRLEELRDRYADLEADDEGELELLCAEWMAEHGEELAELEAAAGDCKGADDADERIRQDPLSVEVRSGWTAPGEPMEAEEFRILLCTGGPACQIRGELDGIPGLGHALDPVFRSRPGYATGLRPLLLLR
jgi:hypothetical protein